MSQVDALEIGSPEEALTGKASDAFQTISEVAGLLGVPQHVLRFWGGRFPQIKPVKGSGGRRYYRPADIALLRGIRHFLYEEGYTIRGVLKVMKERGSRFVAAHGEDSGAAAEPESVAEPAASVAAPVEPVEPAALLNEALRSELGVLLARLEDLSARLKHYGDA